MSERVRRRRRREADADADADADARPARGGAATRRKRRDRTERARRTPLAVQPPHWREAVWGTSWRDPVRGISASTVLAIAGLAALGMAPSEVGAAATLLGTVGLMASVHRYGRLGPDESRPRG